MCVADVRIRWGVKPANNAPSLTAPASSMFHGLPETSASAEHRLGARFFDAHRLCGGHEIGKRLVVERHAAFHSFRPRATFNVTRSKHGLVRSHGRRGL